MGNLAKPKSSSNSPIGVVYKDKSQGSSPVVQTECEPAASLKPWIHSYWTLRWDLPNSEKIPMTVVPNNSVNLIFQQKSENQWLGSKVVGPRKSVYRYHLEGSGFMLGALFEPGGAFDFLHKSLVSLTDSIDKLSSLFGESATELEQELLALNDFETLATKLDQTFTALAPTKPSIDFSLLKKFYQLIVADISVVQVNRLMDDFGVSERTLQRHFNRYIGIAPKQVIRIIRFHEALRAMKGGKPVAWSEFATSLGYFDQSHFVNDFKSITAETPGDFLAQKKV